MNMSQQFWSSKLVASAALIGLVGAAGVYLYEQISAEKKRAMLVSEVQRLDRQMTSMRQELESLRELQKEAKMRREKQKRVRKEAKQQRAPPVAAGDAPDGPDQSYLSDSEYFTDYQSVIGTDHEMDSEEFYDVHTDDDEDTLRDDSIGPDATPRVNGGPEDTDDKVLVIKAEQPPKSTSNST